MPDELNLEHLVAIACRTGAERQTLLHLLGTRAADWREQVRTERSGERLFYRDHAYITEVQLSDTKLRIELENVRTAFTLTMKARGPGGDTWSVEDAEVRPGLPAFTISFPGPMRLHVSIRLDGSLGFESFVNRRELFK